MAIQSLTAALAAAEKELVAAKEQDKLLVAIASQKQQEKEITITIKPSEDRLVVACKHCGQTGLKWAKLPEGKWKLYHADTLRFHSCIQAQDFYRQQAAEKYNVEQAQMQAERERVRIIQAELQRQRQEQLNIEADRHRILAERAASQRLLEEEARRAFVAVWQNTSAQAIKEEKPKEIIDETPRQRKIKA